jgi:aspartate racemase
MSDEGVLGVLGGMGPDATVNFMNSIIATTPATRDQDHIEMVVYNDPKIPDRNTAIREGAESPLPRLQRNAQKLEQSGVTLIALPCNTAHFYYDDLVSSVSVELLNIVEETKKCIQKEGISSAALLSTSTVMETDIYRDGFSDTAIDIFYPEQRDELMNAIYSIKEGDIQTAETIVNNIVSDLENKGADAILVGCSDLSVVSIDTCVPVFDTTAILAEACVAEIKE